MQSKNIYLGQESLEDVLSHIQGCLKRGSSVFSIARGMIGNRKAELIITKEYELHLDEFESDRDIMKLLTEYINDTFGEQMKRSCVTDLIKKIMEKNFFGVDIDEYSDYLTIVLNDGAYQGVHHQITNIMASYKPYMEEKYPEDFKNMTQNEHEVALIKFLKENLISCTNKKAVKEQGKK